MKKRKKKTGHGEKEEEEEEKRKRRCRRRKRRRGKRRAGGGRGEEEGEVQEEEEEEEEEQEKKEMTGEINEYYNFSIQETEQYTQTKQNSINQTFFSHPYSEPCVFVGKCLVSLVLLLIIIDNYTVACIHSYVWYFRGPFANLQGCWLHSALITLTCTADIRRNWGLFMTDSLSSV